MSKPWRETRSQAAAFVAYVYDKDYKAIQKLVQQYPNIETGGDLFGLWKDEKTVIIQQFIGPGKDCSRTATSFHQDIEYLHRVGSLITTEEGLCNVGEWHSHHQIGMPEPSGADRRTVFSNMPHLGLERFVLFIASIEGTGSSGKKRSRDVKPDDIMLRPFLFLGSTQDIIKGKIEIIPGSNPHRLNSRARKEIEDGAEVTPDNAKRTSTSSEENYGRATQQSEKKKKGEKERGNTAQGETKKKDERRTLQQQAEALASQDSKEKDADKPARQPQGEQPQPPRETKPLETGGTDVPVQSIRDVESRGRKPQDNQQRTRQNTGRNSEGKGDQTQRLGDENRSPNTGSAPSRGRGYQSPPTSPSSSQNLQSSTTPPYTAAAQGRGRSTQGNMAPPTSATSSQFWRVLNNSPQPGTAQGSGRDTQGNFSHLANPSTQMLQPTSFTPSSPSAGPHFGTGKEGGRRDQRDMQHQSHAQQGTSQAQAITVHGEGFF